MFFLVIRILLVIAMLKYPAMYHAVFYFETLASCLVFDIPPVDDKLFRIALLIEILSRLYTFIFCYSRATISMFLTFASLIPFLVACRSHLEAQPGTSVAISLTATTIFLAVGMFSAHIITHKITRWYGNTYISSKSNQLIVDSLQKLEQSVVILDQESREVIFCTD